MKSCLQYFCLPVSYLLHLPFCIFTELREKAAAAALEVLYQPVHRHLFPIVSEID